MYARQRTALRCYLRRLLGCFRHSGRGLAVLRIVLILMRQRTAPRCYLRRLAPLVRPPQPPKIDFVDNSRASAKCRSENRAGRSLGARRPEYRCAFHKTGVTPARGPQPRPRGGPLFAFAHSRGRSAGCDPNFAPKSQKNTSNNKKSMQIVVRFNYLYYFWGKRSVGMRRESRCCSRKPEKFTVKRQ